MEGTPIGLELKHGYHTNVIRLKASSFHSPQVRGRVFFVLVKKGICSPAALDAFLHVVTSTFQITEQTTLSQIVEYVAAANVPAIYLGQCDKQVRNRKKQYR